MIKFLNHIVTLFLLIISNVDAQMIHRYGTTTGNFLEIGVDSEGSAMGGTMCDTLGYAYNG